MDLDRVEALSADLERIAETHEEAAPLMRSLVRHFKTGVPHYDWAGIYLSSAGHLRLGPFSGSAAAAEPAPPEEDLRGAVARTGRSQMVADLSATTPLPPARSEIAVPILDGTQVLGIIDIKSEQLNAFNEHDQALLERAASLVAGALGRAPEPPRWEQPEPVN